MTTVSQRLCNIVVFSRRSGTTKRRGSPSSASGVYGGADGYAQGLIRDLGVNPPVMFIHRPACACWSRTGIWEAAVYFQRCCIITEALHALLVDLHNSTSSACLCVSPDAGRVAKECGYDWPKQEHAAHAALSDAQPFMMTFVGRDPVGCVAASSLDVIAILEETLWGMCCCE